MKFIQILLKIVPNLTFKSYPRSKVIQFKDHEAEHTNTNIPEYTLAVLCDLSKAFDVINRDILLKKLNVYGIRGIVNKWFASYLCDRS